MFNKVIETYIGRFAVSRYVYAICRTVKENLRTRVIVPFSSETATTQTSSGSGMNRERLYRIGNPSWIVIGDRGRYASISVNVILPETSAPP